MLYVHSICCRLNTFLPYCRMPVLTCFRLPWGIFRCTPRRYLKQPRLFLFRVLPSTVFYYYYCGKYYRPISVPLYLAWDTFWRLREHFEMNGNQLLRFLLSVGIILWYYAHDCLPIEEFNVGVLFHDATLRVERQWSRLYQEWSSRRLGYNTGLPTRWWAWRRRRKPGQGDGSRVHCYSRLVGGRWKPRDCSFYGDFFVPEGANCLPAWSAKWLQEGWNIPARLAGTRPRGGFSVFWSVISMVESRKNFRIISWGKHNLQGVFFLFCTMTNQCTIISQYRTPTCFDTVVSSSGCS